MLDSAAATLAGAQVIVERNKPLNDSGMLPVEYFVVVELEPINEKTAGGILLPQTKQDREKLECQEGTLIAASPVAFDYAEWPAGSRKPQVGDRVLFKRFEGALHDRNGKTYKLLNDKSIIAILEDENG